MSELRGHLERARRAYAGERYPGDLAAEVSLKTGSLSGDAAYRSGRRIRLLLAPAMISGMAASLVAAVIVTLPETGVRRDIPGPILIDPYPRADLAAVDEIEEDGAADEPFTWAIAGLPAFPEGMEVVPAVSIEGVPGLPSLSWSVAAADEASE